MIHIIFLSFLVKTLLKIFTVSGKIKKYSHIKEKVDKIWGKKSVDTGLY